MPNTHNKLPQDVGEELARLYASGLESRVVAAQTGYSHYTVISWARRLGVPIRRSPGKYVVEIKVCKKCGVEKAANDFYKNRENLDGLTGYCKACETKRRDEKDPDWRKKLLQATKKYRKENFLGSREKGLKRRFKITLEDFDRMLSAQNNACLGCGVANPENKRRFWHVDHDHACCDQKDSTCGKCLRGILCRGCNMALGGVKDNVETLRNLAVYLENSKINPLESIPRPR